MKNIYVLFLCACGVLLSLGFYSCTDNFDDYNTNPDESTVVSSEMLATGLIYNILIPDTRPNWNYEHAKLSKYLAWTEVADNELFFNYLGRQGFGSMTYLYNVDKMVGYAPDESKKTSYQAFGHFIRAWQFYQMTMKVGDIPYSEALNGEAEDGTLYPIYDTQKDVFIGILEELEEADRLFAEGGTFSGDFLFGGDPAKWRKAANSFELKVLNNLYGKTSDTDLNVSGRMRDIVSNKPILTSNGDNLQIVFSDKAGQKYPFYKEGNNFMTFAWVSSEVADSLKKFQDRRLFYYCAPMPSAVAAGVSPSSWDAYDGVETAWEFGDIQSKVQDGKVSTINDRYKEIPEGEPLFIVSYAEQCFILAEAAARGVITGDARAYYEEGVRAAMRFTADNTPDNSDFHHNMKITDEWINQYLANDEVAFASTLNRRIEQIIEQKYLAEFLQDPYNAYFEYRRTGWPVIPVNPSTNLNSPSDKMPMRWMYPNAEYNYNSDNVNEAVARQFNGVDDSNQLIWVLK